MLLAAIACVLNFVLETDGQRTLLGRSHIRRNEQRQRTDQAEC